MGPSNRQGASMRSLRKAARKVAVFHLPCGTLSTRRSPLGFQPRRRVILADFRPGFIDEDQPPGVDEPLIGSPSFAVATYVGAILLACDKSLFLTVTPIRRKKWLIIEVLGFDPSLGRKAIAEEPEA